MIFSELLLHAAMRRTRCPLLPGWLTAVALRLPAVTREPPTAMSLATQLLVGACSVVATTSAERSNVLCKCSSSSSRP